MHDAGEPPLIVHLLYRLDFGGLETVLAECINRMAPDKYRHAIVCLTDYTAFADKITRPGVCLYALHKPPGLGLATHVRLWQLLRRLRPVILHTYNLSAIEYALTATVAGVPVRVHAEHGRDLSDPTGANRKHNLLRRLMTPFIDTFIPVSKDLRHWLQTVIRVPQAKNLLINNGVDTDQFQLGAQINAPGASAGLGMPVETTYTIGTVGRIQDIKNHHGLVLAFEQLCTMLPEQAHRLRLTIAGDGPLMPALRQQVGASRVGNQITLLGARSDIAALMRGFSVFILPSFAEGTPITLLEAMATSLPVVASDVGGIPEVVSPGRNGTLVMPTDHAGMAAALAAYFSDPIMAACHGAAARATIEQHYSITAMLANYTALYDALCLRKVRAPISGKTLPSCAE